MSKTQQEIAAPKACNKNLANFVLFLTTVSFIALAAFAIFAKKTELFANDTVIAAVTLVLLIWLLIATITWALLLKIGRPLYFLMIFAAFTAALVFCLLSVPDAVLINKFTKNMLTMLIASVAIVVFTVFCIIRFRDDKNMVFAMFCGLFLSIPQLFSACLPYVTDKDKTEFASNVWGVAGGSILAALCVYFITVYFTGKQRGHITTKWITYCASFAALSVVFKIMGNAVSFIPFLKFTLTYIPWVVSGIVLGPVGGVVTACVGDVLGQLILPSGFGGLNPLITLSNTLFALFPALMYRYSPLKCKYAEQINLFIGMLISTLVCTLGLGSFAIWWYYYPQMDYWDFFLLQRVYQPIVIAVNYILVIALLPALKRAKLNNLKFIEFSSATKNI